MSVLESKAVRFDGPITLTLEPLIRLTDEAFLDLCQANPTLRLERSATGGVEVMSPSGFWSGHRNGELFLQVAAWNKGTKLGFVSDSSGGFRLPNSAIRSPDLAWVEKSRVERLSRDVREQFAPLCPDFVVEIASPSDDREALQAKLREYISQGAWLGWLIDPFKREVKIYRPGCVVELLCHPSTLCGEVMLPGLTVDLSEILNG